MADPKPLPLPDGLAAEIMAYVMGAPCQANALSAVIGAAVGACIDSVGPRVVAEHLWLFGDLAVDRAKPGE